jgi:hypothetical protein
MPDFDPRFDGLTPDDAFSPVSTFDEASYTQEIVPDFEAYLSDMETRGYGSLADAFIEGAPPTLDGYRDRLSGTFFAEHPEWLYEREDPAVIPDPGWSEKAVFALKSRQSEAALEFQRAVLDETRLRDRTGDFTKIFTPPAEDVKKFQSEFAAYRSRLEILQSATEEALSTGHYDDAESLAETFEAYARDIRFCVSYFLVSHVKDKYAYVAIEGVFLVENHRAKSPDDKPLLSEALVRCLRDQGKRLYGLHDTEKRLERAYGIEIETEDAAVMPRDFRDGLKFDHSNITWLAGQMDRLEKDLAHYPPGVIERTGLKKIMLCVRLWQKNPDRELGGIHRDGFVFLSAQTVFDHELYHSIDNADGLDEDAQWRVETHGDFYESAYVRSRTDDLHPGFASGYAFYESLRSGTAAEDQAEIAHRLFNDYAKLMEDAAREESLGCKVEWVKSRYYALSEGRMDGKFWPDLASGNTVDADYWLEREENQATTGVEFEPDGQGELLFIRADTIASADAAFWAGHYREAAVFYAGLTRDFPLEIVYWERLGQSWEVIGLPLCAIGAYEGAVRSGSRNDAVFRNLTELYRDQSHEWDEAGRSRFAASRWLELIDGGCLNPEAYRTLAKLVAFDLKDPGAAVLLYKNSIDPCRDDGRIDFVLIPYFLKWAGEVRGVLPNSGSASLQAILSFCADHLRYAEPLGAFYAALDEFAVLKEWEAALPALRSAVHANPKNQYLRRRYIEFLKAAKIEPELSFQLARAKEEFPWNVVFQ